MRALTIALAFASLAGAASAAEVKMLAAASMQPGLEAATAAHARRTPVVVHFDYATGPEIGTRIAAGETPDLVIAPMAMLTGLRQAGKLALDPKALGKVNVAMAVHTGHPAPDISNVDAMKRAMTGARAIVISHGSNGVYMDSVIQRFGMTAQLGDHVVHVANGAAVVARIAENRPGEIAFSATTELAQGRDRGVVIVAPLPAAVQNAIVYGVGVLPTAGPEARALAADLAGTEARGLMQAQGIDAPT